MGGSEIFFWWMVVGFGTGVTTLPIPYQTEQACAWAAEHAVGTHSPGYVCIPQPAADVAEFSAAQAVGREPEVCEIPTP